MILSKIFRLLAPRATLAAPALLLALLIAAPSARAAHAAFSMDQHFVYLAPFDNKGTLQAVDLETSETHEQNFPKIAQLPGNSEIKAISPSEAGGYWLLTEKALWQWDGGKASAKKIAAAPEGVTFDDVAAQREGEAAILITGRLAHADEFGRVQQVFVMQNANGPLLKVFVRRLDEIRCPVFLDDGTLLFGAEGDLWHGEVGFELGENKEVDRGVLDAYRYAPLATRETYNGTPMQTGVSQIAVSQEMIYVWVSRMGGSGWGDLIRLKRPPRSKKGELDLHWDLQARLEVYANAIRSVQILDPDCSANPFLCGSADGALIHVRRFYGQGKERHFIVTHDGPIEPVPQKPKK